MFSIAFFITTAPSSLTLQEQRQPISAGKFSKREYLLSQGKET